MKVKNSIRDIIFQRKKGTRNKLLIKLFTIIYKKWLYCDHTKEYDIKITRIFGWRTFRTVSSWGEVRVVSPVFWCFK